MNVATNRRTKLSCVCGGIVVVIPLLGSLAMSAGAYAQAVVGQATTLGPREVLLGTSTSTSRHPSAPAPTTLGDHATAAGADDAQAYYDAAEREFSRGRVGVAQRHLEWLVARYPQTPIAAVARHDLIALQGQNVETRQRPASLQLPVAPTPVTPASDGSGLGTKTHLGAPLSAVPIAVGSAAAAPTGWRTATADGPAPGSAPGPAAGASTARPTKRPPRTVQDTFRQAAGDLVFFSDGSAELGTRARRVLEAQADWLKLQPTTRLMIEGHADDSGSMAENLKLSDARAKAVMKRLVEAGIEPGRFTAVAVGKTKRVADCDDLACAAQNRRVATVIVAQSVVLSVVTVAPSADRLPWNDAPSPR